jgi:predicted transcriptional regulator
MTNHAPTSSPIEQSDRQEETGLLLGSASTQQGATTLDAAAKMHALNRRRAFHFNTPVMADSAMDVMLTVLIAQEQHVPISLNAIIMANRLQQDSCEKLLGDLASAGLLCRKGAEGAVRLTTKGLAQMQEYLRVFG